MNGRMPEPYKEADRLLQRLTSLILKRREKVQRKLLTLGFDELNVMQEVDYLYEYIETMCEAYYRLLYTDRYWEMWEWLTGEEPDEDEVDELFELFLAGLLNNPNPVVHYAFQAELIRKRDRAKEAIIAVPTKAQKQLELEKNVRYVIQQAGFFMDITEDEADLMALKNADIKKVRWVIYGDDRVCETCQELDGTVWDVDNVPNKPHPRCRCYLRPVTSLKNV